VGQFTGKLFLAAALIFGLATIILLFFQHWLWFLLTLWNVPTTPRLMRDQKPS
jgi:hypothetical protein